jgi:hypothetical protein
MSHLEYYDNSTSQCGKHSRRLDQYSQLHCSAYYDVASCLQYQASIPARLTGSKQTFNLSLYIVREKIGLDGECYTWQAQYQRMGTLLSNSWRREFRRGFIFGINVALLRHLYADNIMDDQQEIAGVGEHN